jgi:hypothetical protein
MNKITFVLAAALSVAAVGCKKKTGADCGKAITNSMAVSKADIAATPGVDDKVMAKMAEIGMQRCKEDKWGDDVVRCMSDAKTKVDAQGCYAKMSAEQRDKMNMAAMEMMTPTGASCSPTRWPTATPGSRRRTPPSSSCLMAAAPS